MTKVWVFVVLITITHCYYGYTVRGGPEQVGRAAGRAIRASIVRDRPLGHADDARLLGHFERDQVLGMSGRSRVRGQALVGVALLLVIVAAGYGIIAAFTGHFSSYDVVYADVPASGTGISPGSVVIFRDITVGSVGSLGQELPDGLIRVQLHMTPGDLATIPSGVKADVEIATVFGTQGINLVPQPGAAPGHLRVGETIGSVGVSKTTTLQGDATDLDNLLNALHPAALDETLSAIATALKNQGPQLGTTIGQVATYLDQMLPEVPDIVNDVGQLGPSPTR